MKPILAITGVFLLAAASVSCGGADGGVQDASALLERAAEAMTSASFSYTDTECPLCQPTPTVSEYAPPDRIKLSHPKGHDDWPYYLIVGDQWYVSQAGIRWLTESADSAHIGMLLLDPRVLLRTAKDADVEGDDVIDGRRHHVVRAGLDIDRFLAEILPAEVSEEARSEESREFYDTYYGALRLRFWIDERTHVLSQVELDLPPLSDDDIAEGGEDHEPFTIRFDYEALVDVPAAPESMTYEEAQEFRRLAESRTPALLEAIVNYRKLQGVYPPNLDPETLRDVLPPSRWPINPFADEPIKESEDSPGDFHYVVKNQGQDFELSLFGWDSTYSYRDTVRFGHPEDFTD